MGVLAELIIEVAWGKDVKYLLKAFAIFW